MRDLGEIEKSLVVFTSGLFVPLGTRVCMPLYHARSGFTHGGLVRHKKVHRSTG